MEMEIRPFMLTPTEWIFLGAAVLVTIPMVIFLMWALKQLKAEPPPGDAPHPTPDNNIMR